MRLSYLFCRTVVIKASMNSNKIIFLWKLSSLTSLQSMVLLLCCFITTPFVWAESGDTASTRKAVLEARVLAKWAALIKGDFEAAYKFSSPAYRELHSLDFFRSRFGGKIAWTKAEVLDVQLKDKEVANAIIKLHYDLFQKETGRTLQMFSESQETWVYSGDEWWYAAPE